MSEKSHIARSAYIMSVATFISRVLGFVRDMITARLFGATGLADAFFTAYRIPNLFRELFAEGSMSSAFIPVLTGTAAKEGEEAANRLVRVMFTFILIVVGALCVLGIICAPYLIQVIAPGFATDPAKFEQAVILTRIMFPFLLFVSLAALTMGALNTRRSFFVPALASSWYNVAVIVTLLLLVTRLANPIAALAIGVTIGGFFQFASQLVTFYRRGFDLGIDTGFGHPGLRQIGVLIVPATLGMAVNQINIVTNNIFASFLAEGSITFLYYSMRLIQFPIGIFGVAMSMAALPSLSRHAAGGDLGSLREDFSFSIRLLFFITIPAMVGLIALGGPIVNLLFQRGMFDHHATTQTVHALIAYSLGIWSIVGVKLVTSAFYSLQDTRTPFRVLVAAVLLNVAFSFLLMHPLRHTGLALANTLASGINFVLLFALLRKKLGGFGARRIIVSFMKTLASAVVMGGAGYFILRGDLWTTGGATLHKSVILTAAIALSLAVYGAMCYLVRSDELHYVISTIGRKFRKEG